jgi:hypothetical protein
VQQMNEPMMLPEELDELEVEALGGSDEDFLARVNSMEGVPVPDNKPVAPSMGASPDVRVKLPVPLSHPTKGVLDTAEVRELTGEDEEYIQKGRARHDRIDRLVERGTESIGGEPVDQTVVQALTIGSRDALMLGIRRATYGDELELELTCRKCSADQRIAIDLATEIESLDGEDEAEVELRRSGKALVRWPTVSDESLIMDAIESTPTISSARLNTMLIGRVLVSVAGTDAFGEETARALPMPARQDLVKFLDENTPGPKFQVEHSCAECGQNSPVSFTYEEMFR